MLLFLFLYELFLLLLLVDVVCFFFRFELFVFFGGVFVEVDLGSVVFVVLFLVEDVVVDVWFCEFFVKLGVDDCVVG